MSKILGIIYRPVPYLEHEVSETGHSLRLEVKLTKSDTVSEE
jgi:hypothetical protein